MLVALSGKASSGKDVVASMLKGKGFKHRAFATQVKRIAKQMFDLTEEEVNDAILKEEVNLRWGKTPRAILQQIGVKLREIHPDIWVQYVFNDFELYDMDKERFVISDMRFPNELAAIRAAGGFCVRIHRPGAKSKTGSKDISETALDTEKSWDWALDNSKDIEHLQRQVNEMLRDFTVRLNIPLEAPPQLPALKQAHA